MHVPKLALCAGVGVLALAGMARAETPGTQVMNIPLPNGQIEQIRYQGDVAPLVTVVPDAGATPAAMAADPFAMLRLISAEMDAQAAAQAAVMLQAMAMPIQMGPVQMASGMAFPAGIGPITVAAGPGVCMRSVQITDPGNGQAPHVVSRTEGDCAPAGRAASSAAVREAPAPARPAIRTYQARYVAPAPDRHLIRPVSSLSR